MVISEPDRFDRNRNRSGILIFIGEDIPSQLLVDHKLPHDTEGVKSEKKKWLLFWVVPST